MRAQQIICQPVFHFQRDDIGRDEVVIDAVKLQCFVDSVETLVLEVREDGSRLCVHEDAGATAADGRVVDEARVHHHRLFLLHHDSAKITAVTYTTRHVREIYSLCSYVASALQTRILMYIHAHSHKMYVHVQVQ